MRYLGKLTLFLFLVLALALTTTPLAAQGNGKAKEKEKKNHPHQVQQQRGNSQAQSRGQERNAQRPQLERRDRNAQPQARQKQRGPHGSVPPGWCLGRGNPHNTPENCGLWNGRNWDWQARDNRQFRSFEEAHAAFHRVHDQRCRERAAERPLDPVWQVRVRADCRAEHDRWHERYDPNWRG